MDQDEELVNAEAELLQLRQRYRIVENDRKAYLDESGNVLRKQRNYIHKLQQEKDEFNVDMQLVRCLANQKRDAQYLQTMNFYIESCVEADRQIEEVTHDLQMLDKKYATLLNGNLDHMRVLGGWDADQARHVTSMKKIRVMENKLDKHTVGFNKALSKNHDLRERIAQLRRELNLYGETHKKLFKKQTRLKNKMNEIIEMSTAAYDSREECLNRIATIRERNDKDELAYNNHVKDLKRVLLHEQRLKEFMNMKTKDRSNLLKAASEATKRKLAKSSKTCLHQTEIKSYETVFERLKAYFGESVLDLLVRNFLNKEAKAFALFNYNSELECDVENIGQKNKSLKKDIDMFKAQGVELEGDRVHIMKDLEAQATETTANADGVEARLKSCRKDLHQIMHRIVAFIKELGCDETMVTNKLGCRGTINETNAMEYLGLAEFVSNDIKLVEAFHKHLKTLTTKSSKKSNPAAAQGSVIQAKLRPKSPVAISIDPPTIDDDGEISSDMEHILSTAANLDDTEPLGPNDIRSHIVKAIERREYLTKKKKEEMEKWSWHATNDGLQSKTVAMVPGEDHLDKSEHSLHPDSAADILVHESHSSDLDSH